MNMPMVVFLLFVEAVFAASNYHLVEIGDGFMDDPENMVTKCSSVSIPLKLSRNITERTDWKAVCAGNGRNKREVITIIILTTTIALAFFGTAGFFWAHQHIKSLREDVLELGKALDEMKKIPKLMQSQNSQLAMLSERQMVYITTLLLNKTPLEEILEMLKINATNI